MTTSERIALLRTVLLGLTGLTCVAYSVLALVQGRPDPMPWWVPGGMGVLASAIITASFAQAGPQAIRGATDELHRQVNSTAQQQAYWLCLVLFVLVAVSVSFAGLDAATGYAVLGTSMGATYLLLFVFHEWRLR